MNLQIPTGTKALIAAALAAGAFATTSAMTQAGTNRGLMLGGGLLAASSALGLDMKRRNEKRKEEAKSRELSDTFIRIYDTYRGTVQVVELAMAANITLQEAETFLASVAEASQGKKIDVGTGVAYTFPHAQSTLVELNKRATEWATNQVQALQMENQNLKTQLQAAHMAFLQGRQQQTEAPEIALPTTLGQVRPTQGQHPNRAAWEAAQQESARPTQNKIAKPENPWNTGLL